MSCRSVWATLACGKDRVGNWGGMMAKLGTYSYLRSGMGMTRVRAPKIAPGGMMRLKELGTGRVSWARRRACHH